MSASSEFEHELDIYRREVEAGMQFLYAYLAIHGLAAKYRSVYRALNEAPLFWNTTLGALQTSLFIVLGRIFDQKSKHNVDRLLRVVQKNRDIFSVVSLERRRLANTVNRPDYLDDFLSKAYEPSSEDFRNLRSQVSNWRKVYDSNYRDIRRKYFAHREVSGKKDVDELFSKTQIRELQTLLLRLHSIHEALWQLYSNGNKPVLRPRRISLSEMLKRKAGTIGNSDVHETLVNEARDFFLGYSK